MLSVRSSFIEPLESRRMLDGTAGLGNGLLQIIANATTATTITIGNTADGLSVSVSVSWNSINGPRSISKTFAKSRVINSIYVKGGRGNDTIVVDQTFSNFTIPMFIDAGYGNDHVQAGAEDDTIGGGWGNDYIDAGDGTNLVRGAMGNDTLIAGSGSDKMDGGIGNDVLSGGGGNDTLVGGWGRDSINCGDGDDVAYGGHDRDTLDGGNGNDTLWGGTANDTLIGGAGDDTLGGVQGRNQMIGGAGHDTFRLIALVANPVNDYNAAEDILIRASAEAQLNQV